MHNKSILLVDDDEFVLNSLSTNLSRAGYNVTIATSGEKAIGLQKSNKFDLIITDLNMPGIDGIQVLKEAKKINFLTVVIILTGFGNMDSAIKAIRLGADDYLIKPYRLEELLIHIGRCFEKQTKEIEKDN